MEYFLDVYIMYQQTCSTTTTTTSIDIEAPHLAKDELVSDTLFCGTKVQLLSRLELPPTGDPWYHHKLRNQYNRPHSELHERLLYLCFRRTIPHITLSTPAHPHIDQSLPLALVLKNQLHAGYAIFI
jgi:hypothetical protein